MCDERNANKDKENKNHLINRVIKGKQNKIARIKTTSKQTKQKKS